MTQNGLSIVLRTALIASMIWAAVLILMTRSATVAVATGQTTSGVQRAAMTLAGIPPLVRTAWIEAGDRLSGREADKYLSVPRFDGALAGFDPVDDPGGDFAGLTLAGDPSAAAPGWRLLAGAFSTADGVRHAALLLDPAFAIRRSWQLTGGLPDGLGGSDSRKIVHGLDLLPDGTLVATFDHGTLLQARDMCDRLLWTREGVYHHSVDSAGDGTLWVPRHGGFAAPDGGFDRLTLDDGFVQIDSATGAVLREVSMVDVLAANPGTGLFTLKRRDDNDPTRNSMEFLGKWRNDPYHFNDIEALPADIARAFPRFRAGDLLISARNLNTVFVLDHETLEMKWSRTGAAHRQHDADWNPDGTISLYDNRMSLGPSQVIALTPGKWRRDVLFDGAEADFYSRIRGKHTILPGGGVAVASPQQGRAFETDAAGGLTVEFLNRNLSRPDKNLVITEYHWFPADTFQMEDITCPAS